MCGVSKIDPTISYKLFLRKNECISHDFMTPGSIIFAYEFDSIELLLFNLILCLAISISLSGRVVANISNFGVGNFCEFRVCQYDC